MKKSLALMALRLIPQKKQNQMLAKVLDYVIPDSSASFVSPFPFCVKIHNSKQAWIVERTATSILPALKPVAPEVTFELQLQHILKYPTQSKIKDLIKSGEILVSGDQKRADEVLELLGYIEQEHLNKCIRKLRQVLKVEDGMIEDKPLTELTVRDITSQDDVNYVRDQALIFEANDPSLAYALMSLAHAARPKGPFIERKLHEYKAKSYNKQFKDRSLYGIEVVSDNVTYFPIPKVACSSIKMALYAAKKNNVYDKDNHDGIHIHDYWSRNQKPLERYKQKVIVVRDPIERFLSAYSNRVLDHAELNRNAIKRECPWLLKTLPHFRPTLAQFIEHFDLYNQVPVINHHCKPVSHMVNGDLKQFTDVIPLESIGHFVEIVSSALSKEITLPRAQVSKHKISLAALEQAHIELLCDMYSQDYETLAPLYSKEKIMAKWKQAKAKCQKTS